MSSDVQKGVIAYRFCWTNPPFDRKLFSFWLKVTEFLTSTKIQPIDHGIKSQTLGELAYSQVAGFSQLQYKLGQCFSINGKAISTLFNFLRCIEHPALHYKQIREKHSVESIED